MLSSSLHLSHLCHPSLSHSLSLWRVAFIELPLRFMICKCSVAAAQLLRLFSCFSMTFRRTWQILCQGMHSILHTHTHACFMCVYWGQRWQSSSHECALVRLSERPSAAFSLMSIAFYVQDMTGARCRIFAGSRVLFDNNKMGHTY